MSKKMVLGITIFVMAGMLIGTSSGGLFTDSAGFSESGWGWTGLPAEMHPSNTSPFGYVKPFNLSEYLYPDPKVPQQADIPPWEPVPLVMPEPLPITKADLFKSITTISQQKQSLISSLSSAKSLPVSF